MTFALKQFTFKEDREPHAVCTKNYPLKMSTMFNNFMRNGFGYQLYLDGLPAAVMLRDPATGDMSKSYSTDIPIGYRNSNSEREEFVVYNHLDMEIMYNTVGTNKAQVVGFVVTPRSV